MGNSRECTVECTLRYKAKTPCLWGKGPTPCDLMIVGEAPGYNEDIKGQPFVGRAGQLLDSLLKETGLHRDQIYITNSVKCRPPSNRTPTRKQVKICSVHLQEEIKQVQPKAILCLGNTALQAVVGSSGINKHRGRWLKSKEAGIDTVATFHPAAALRNPSRIPLIKADLTLFTNREYAHKVPKFPLRIVRSVEDVLRCLKACKKARVIAYDLETKGDDTVLCMSLALGDEYGKVKPVVYFVPLGHPQSPLRRKWKDIMRLFIPLVERRAPYKAKIVGQNIKFDDSWFIKLFDARPNPTFDTMLASHLIDENTPHGLDYLSQVYAGAPAYKHKVNRRALDETPIREVMEYNAQDSYYTLKIYQVLRHKLLRDGRLHRIFKYCTMPGARVLELAEQKGLWVNPDKLAEATKITEDKLKDVIEELSKYTLEDGKPVNWNSPQQVAWILFHHLELDIIERTATGAPSTKESVLVELKGQHPIIEQILSYRELSKLLSTYLRPWAEKKDEHNRLHTNFLLHGTVTGRLASANPNLQNVPRDQVVRSVIGAPPGWKLVEADYSQIELRVAAHIACEPTMLRIYQTGGDIHRETASIITGKPLDMITSDERKKAKAVNFGFLYGMGAKTFQEYSKTQYGIEVSQEEAHNFRDRFFQKYGGLRHWHQRQVDIATRLGYVRSPLGRKRRLPDIYSTEDGVRMLAERQAINSPVQAVPPDLTLLAMNQISRVPGYGDECFIVGQVHDSIMLEVREDVVDKWCAVIKKIMENPPLKKLFGVEFLAPILVEVTVGDAWGQGEEWKE